MSEKTDFKKIKKVLDFAWDNSYSSFYKDKYKKAGLDSANDITSIEDFKKLPYLTKEDIVNSDPFDRFFLPWSKFSSVVVSSGTTGGSGSLSIILAQEGEMGFYKRVIKDVKKEGKELKYKSCMRLLPPLLGARALTESYRLMDKIGKTSINVLGDINNLPLSAKLAAKLKIDFLSCSPTVLYFFLPYLKREYDLNKIKKITLLGEYCSKQKALLFKALFKNTIFSYNYGISESQGDSFGLFCKELDSLATNYFHLSPSYYFEIISKSREGELVVTSLQKKAFPLIRFKTGDIVKLEDYSCKCGAKQRLKILGRVKFDVFRIHGAMVYRELVEKAIIPFQNYLGSPLWQIHIFEKIKKDKIYPQFKLQLILKDKYKENIKNMLSEEISKNFYLSPSKTLADLVKEKLFLPLQIEFVGVFSNSTKHRYIVSHLE